MVSAAGKVLCEAIPEAVFRLCKARKRLQCASSVRLSTGASAEVGFAADACAATGEGRATASGGEQGKPSAL